MLRSIAIPGWGQWALGKRRNASVFFLGEFILADISFINYMMAGRNGLSEIDQAYYRENGKTFLILWGITRAMGTLDAFVGAHLRNFNVDDVK
jgi:hypothetical protein